MMSSPSTSSKKTFMKNANKRPCEHCPECAKRNVQSRLRHYKVNLDFESFKMCENDECLYPLMTKELDDILVVRDVFGRKNKGKLHETNDFGSLNWSNGLYSSNEPSNNGEATRSTEIDVFRDLFVGNDNGVAANATEVASLVSMLETVTSDGSVPVTNNKTVISNPKKNVARTKSVSATTNKINTKLKTVTSKDETFIPFSKKPSPSKTCVRTSMIKERPNVDATKGKFGNSCDFSELRTSCVQTTSVETLKEVRKPKETQTNSRNPLMRFIMAKQKAKDNQRSVPTAKPVVETTQNTIVSKSLPKDSVLQSKPSPRKITKDVTTANRIVTSWLSSANADGKTTFPGYLSTVKQKDDGFISEDSGIQSPESLLSGESEPVSIRQDAMHQTI